MKKVCCVVLSLILLLGAVIPAFSASYARDEYHISLDEGAGGKRNMGRNKKRF